MCANKGSVDLWLPRDRDSAAALCTALGTRWYRMAEGQHEMRCASITSCRENLYATLSSWTSSSALPRHRQRRLYTQSCRDAQWRGQPSTKNFFTTRVVVGFAHVNISVTLGPISEREHFRNFKAYPGNISTPYFFFGALRARRGVPQYEALRSEAARAGAPPPAPCHSTPERTAAVAVTNRCQIQTANLRQTVVMVRAAA